MERLQAVFLHVIQRMEAAGIVSGFAANAHFTRMSGLPEQLKAPGLTPINIS